MNTVYVLIMVISGGSGASSIHTQEFNQETTCKMAADEINKFMENSWKNTLAVCVQK